MKKFKIIVSLLIMSVLIGFKGFDAVQGADVELAKPVTSQQAQQNTAKTYQTVSPLNIVAQPGFYVGKNVKFKAKFDKFSTLGLDYKPAYRSSEKYITLLILRPDVTNHDIPLSELKIFIDRETAEKYIDLNSGDEIEISGRIFSKALGDAWMCVDSFDVLKTTPKTDNK